MDEYVLLILAGTVLFALIILTTGLLQFRRDLKKLTQDFQLLNAQIQRTSGDLAGLCSAAVLVDKRLSESESYLSRILDDLENHQPSVVESNDQVFEKRDDGTQGYGLAIEKIKRGASLDDLVKNFGLTRDEAVLLMRLHGEY